MASGMRFTLATVSSLQPKSSIWQVLLEFLSFILGYDIMETFGFGSPLAMDKHLVAVP